MLLTGMPTQLQTPGPLGYVRADNALMPPRAPSSRFRSLGHYGAADSPAYYEGEPNTYPGTWQPFYNSARTWWNDKTLQVQAPRQGPGYGPSENAWYDETLVLQAQRGPDTPYGPQLGAAGDVKEMSGGTKVALAFGVAAVLVGGSYLVLRHTFREGLWPE
jgi:hypothetical protein